MWRGGAAHSFEGMQHLFVAMTLAASLHVPAAAASTASCEFVYVRDNTGYSQCHSGTGYQHRADGWCTWIGPFVPEISEYAERGPWAEPTGKSTVTCRKYYHLSAEVEIR